MFSSMLSPIGLYAPSNAVLKPGYVTSAKSLLMMRSWYSYIMCLTGYMHLDTMFAFSATKSHRTLRFTWWTSKSFPAEILPNTLFPSMSLWSCLLLPKWTCPHWVSSLFLTISYFVSKVFDFFIPQLSYPLFYHLGKILISMDTWTNSSDTLLHTSFHFDRESLAIIL